MKRVKLEHFNCQGADKDEPKEGFEVIESDLPNVKVGTFLLDADVANLKSAGCKVSISETDNEHED